MRRIHTPIAPAKPEPAFLLLLLLLTCAPWARPQPDLYAAGTGESQHDSKSDFRVRQVLSFGYKCSHPCSCEYLINLFMGYCPSLQPPPFVYLCLW